MADNEKLTENDDDFVVVETPSGKQPPAEPKTPPPTDDDHDDHDDADDEADERLADADASDAERNTKREQNREERRARRARQRAMMERDKRVLSELAQQNQILAQRLAQLEGRSVHQDRVTIEQRMREAESEQRTAEALLAEAVRSGDGEEHVRALRIRDAAVARANQLAVLRQRADQAAEQAQQPHQARQQAPQIDPAVVNHGQAWMGQNSWYDPQARDEDSAIVKIIDDRLASEGYDPKDPGYWKELSKRVERRLPHRAAKAEDPADDRPAGRRGPPVGGSREHAPASTRREVYVSPERKAALVEMGVWDDPKARARYLKSFAAYDKNNPAR
jgi:hypothetical protein